MTEFEMEDVELAAVMGDKFVDETIPLAEMPKETKKAANTTPAKKTAQKPAQRPAEEKTMDAAYHPVKPHTWMDALMACAKWVAVFGGLNMLIFYWQIEGLMDESIAVPCMWVCCVLAGFGVGLNAWWCRK